MPGLSGPKVSHARIRSCTPAWRQRRTADGGVAVCTDVCLTAPAMRRPPGCTLYAMDVQDRRDPTADTHRSADTRQQSPVTLKLRLVVVIRRKLIIFEWVHQAVQFREVREINLPHTPEAVQWAGDCIIVGLKKECVAAPRLDCAFPPGSHVYTCTQHQHHTDIALASRRLSHTRALSRPQCTGT